MQCCKYSGISGQHDANLHVIAHYMKVLSLFQLKTTTISTVIDDEQLQNWEWKRKRTIAGYLLVGIICGIDDSAVFTTLYMYLTDVIKTERPILSYAVVLCAFNISSILTGLIARWLVDKTRKMKMYTNIVLISLLIGNVVYLLPYSVYFTIVGRAITGFGDTFTSVCSGEIVRIYSTEEGTGILWWLASSFSIGLIIGPVCNIAFGNSNYNFGLIKITNLNCASLFIAIIVIAVVVAVNILVHDCSAEMDLKHITKQARLNEIQLQSFENPICNESSAPTIVQPTTIPANISTQNMLRIICTNRNLLFMLSSTFLFAYCIFSCDVLLPLIILNILEWNQRALTIIMIVHGIAYLISLIFLSKWCISKKSIYNTCIFCCLCLIIDFVLIIAINTLDRNFARDVALIILFLLANLFVWFLDEVILKNMTSRMVPSDLQCLTESIRSGMSSFSSILAALTAPMILTYLHWWSTGMICLTMVPLFVFLSWKSSLINITEIPFRAPPR